jgi:hypothetical protein
VWAHVEASVQDAVEDVRPRVEPTQALRPQVRTLRLAHRVGLGFMSPLRLRFNLSAVVRIDDRVAGRRAGDLADVLPDVLVNEGTRVDILRSQTNRFGRSVVTLPGATKHSVKTMLSPDSMRYAQGLNFLLCACHGCARFLRWRPEDEVGTAV